MERWVGKIAVVTGASSGIGASLSVRLANLGITVVGLARRAHLIDELGSKVSGKGSIHSRQCDLSNSDEVISALQWIEQKFGGPDILVNNAGYFANGNITEVGDKSLNDEAILLTIDLNFKAVVLCTRLAIASMKKRNCNGYIININSTLGHYVPANPYMNIYPATKHAVTAFNTALLNELSTFKSKIKVTSISPGVVDTNMPPSYLHDIPKLDSNDVVDAVVFALSTPPNVNVYELGITIVGEPTF